MTDTVRETAFLPFSTKIDDTRELDSVIDQLSAISRFLFKDKQGTIRDKATEFISPVLAEIFAELEKLGLEPADDKNQQIFLNEAILYLRSLPKVKVTLAFVPSKNFLNFLNRQISESCQGKVVLEVFTDSRIMGGLIIEYKGKVFSDILESKLNDSLVRFNSRFAE